VLLFSTELHVEKLQEANIEQYCEPRPVIQRLSERIANGHPDPRFTIVNKCRCGDVCENSSHRCVAVSQKNVSRPFVFVVCITTIKTVDCHSAIIILILIPILILFITAPMSKQPKMNSKQNGGMDRDPA